MKRLAYKVRKGNKFMIITTNQPVTKPSEQIKWGKRSEAWVCTSSQAWLEKMLAKWGVTGYTLEKTEVEVMYL
jgi:hypothetical protein